MKRILYIAAIVLLASGCARTASSPANEAAKRYFDAWISVHYPNISPSGKGIYILEDKPGTGDELSQSDTYVFLNYSIADLNGEISGTTFASVAQQLGTYDKTYYYGPHAWLLDKDALTAGIREVLRGMKVGGRRVAISPGWLNAYAEYDTEQEYIDNCTGNDLILTIEVADKTKDIVQWEIDSLQAYVNKTMGFIDSTKYGYYQKVRAAGDDITMPTDTTIYINYTGRLLNGLVFDTTIEDTAKFYGLYSASKTYKPVAINLTENYKEITMGEDSDSSSTLVEGFSFCCSQLHPFEKITCAFYSGLGYSSSGSGNSIPSFAGLRFDIDVVAKP